MLAAPAAAHVSVDPQRVATGALVDLTFSAPNEAQPGGVHRVTLTVPPSFDLDDAEAKPTWTQTRAGRSVTWSGGTIPVGQFATFRIRGTVPSRAGPVTFGLRSGSAVYRIAVDAVASPGADQGARTLGKVALGIAIGAALLAVAGLFAELYRWLRS